MAAAMFTLTAMTGREASAHRTVVIGTVEMNWRVWMILLFTFPLALIVTLVLLPFVGITSLLAIPVIEGLAVFAIHRRSRSGMKLRTYQTFLDKRRSVLNQYFLGGQPIDLDLSNYQTIYSASVSSPFTPSRELDPLNPPVVGADGPVEAKPTSVMAPARPALEKVSPFTDGVAPYLGETKVVADPARVALIESVAKDAQTSPERNVSPFSEPSDSPHDRGVPVFASTGESS